MSSTRRVYHPTLDCWQDVPKGDADKWKEAGWRLTKPAHITQTLEPVVENEPVVVTATDNAPQVAE